MPAAYEKLILLALVPGLLRGCLRIKSLLPESVLPGWFLAAAAPMQILVLLAALLGVAGVFTDDPRAALAALR